METDWDHHFKYYDLFQNSFDRYCATINFQLKELINCQNILDSGAGSGNLTLKLLEKGKKITAIDFNEFALRILKKKCNSYSDSLEVEQMSVESLNFGEKFDGVSSMFVISFVKDNQKYFSGVYSSLRTGGKFVISSWAAVPDTLKGILEPQKKELENKGVLPKYQKEWDYIMESVNVAVNDVINGPSLEEIKTILKKVGFKDIKVHESPYGKYAHFLTCEK